MMEPIGFVRSPFREKFGVPRQAALMRSSAIVKLAARREFREALRGLEGFSHLWVVFVFHQARGWKPLVRPPRLGGGKKVGVFASRSPHRPNPIGLSLVRVLSVDAEAPGGAEIRIGGCDFVDGTPVLDLKPYVPYADVGRRASKGWAEKKIPRLRVRFEAAAERALRAARDEYPELRTVLREMLRLDPRPAFQARRGDSGAYAARIERFDVRWRVEGGACVVTALEPV